VFISCGQTRYGEEERIAQDVAAELRRMGYDPYVAIEEHTFEGVKDNIFQKLKESEYFLFIDFKREEFKDGTHRGSLFCHQELALAVYLSMDLMVFQEKGVKEGDGILGSIQANPILFGDRDHLPILIAAKINESKWKPDWKNKLVVQRNDESEFKDAALGIDGPSRWYHITVRNVHKDEMAHDCAAYVKSSKKLSPDGPPNSYESVQLKWQGIPEPNISIAQNSNRNFDALIIPHKQSNLAYFGSLWSAEDFKTPPSEKYHLEGPGEFELNFIVYSSNFPPTQSKFFLQLGDTLQDVKFYKST
jgi:hypothetical protein